LGKRLRFGSGQFREIVGVVRNAKYRNLREEPLPFIYTPFAQEPQTGMTLIVRPRAIRVRWWAPCAMR
jgi:hypothetical protein